MDPISYPPTYAELSYGIPLPDSFSIHNSCDGMPHISQYGSFSIPATPDGVLQRFIETLPSYIVEWASCESRIMLHRTRKGVENAFTMSLNKISSKILPQLLRENANRFDSCIAPPSVVTSQPSFYSSPPPPVPPFLPLESQYAAFQAIHADDIYLVEEKTDIPFCVKKKQNREDKTVNLSISKVLVNEGPKFKKLYDLLASLPFLKQPPCCCPDEELIYTTQERVLPLPVKGGINCKIHLKNEKELACVLLCTGYEVIPQMIKKRGTLSLMTDKSGENCILRIPPDSGTECTRMFSILTTAIAVIQIPLVSVSIEPPRACGGLDDQRTFPGSASEEAAYQSIHGDRHPCTERSATPFERDFEHPIHVTLQTYTASKRLDFE